MGNGVTLHFSRRPGRCEGSGIANPVRLGLASVKRLLAVLILTGTLLTCGTAPAVEKDSGVIIYTTLDHGRDETAIGVPFVKAEQFALVTNVTTPDGKSFRVTANMLKEIVRPPDLSRLTVVDEAGLQSLKASAQSLRTLQKRFPRAAGALEGISGEMERTAQVIESGNVLYEGGLIPKSDYENRMAAAAPKTFELTVNGRLYSRARLTSVGVGKVSITHGGGVATINIADLDAGSIALLRESNPGLSIQRSIPCILGFSIPCDALLEAGPDTVKIQANGQTSLIATELIDLNKIPNTAEWRAPLREAVEARDRTIEARVNEASPSPCVLTPYGSFLPLKKSHLVTSNGLRFAHSMVFATTPVQEFDHNPMFVKGGSAVTVLVYGNSSRLVEPNPDTDLEGSVSKELASMEKTQVLGYPLLHKKEVNPKIESEEFVFNNPDGTTSFWIRIENSVDSDSRYDANEVVLEFLSSWAFDRHPAEMVIPNSDALLGPRDAVPEEWTVSLKDAETLKGLWFDEDFDEKAWERRELQDLEAERIPLLTESIDTLIGRYGVRLARREAAETAARQIRSGVEGFVGECITELRHQTAQLCDEMLSSMRSGKTDGVHQKTLNRLVKFIDDFKSLNFAGDVEMEGQLDRVRSELLTRSAEDYRNNLTATRSLETGLTQLRDQARELASQDARALVERFGQMGRRKLQLAG